MLMAKLRSDEPGPDYRSPKCVSTAHVYEVTSLTKDTLQVRAHSFPTTLKKNRGLLRNDKFHDLYIDEGQAARNCLLLGRLTLPHITALSRPIQS
jgi:hypothetical protein